jgi:histidinol-phosphate aminotransferase
MPRGHDLDAIAATIADTTRLVHLANPNNPTGTWYGADAFAAFMRKVPENVIVVVDEAYAEFVDAPDWASALTLVARHPNLVVTRTFSKAYALAGLRVFPSQTNFLLVKFAGLHGDEPGDEAQVAAIDAALIERGVVLRPMGGYGLGHCLRITVGTAAENRRLLDALDEVLPGEVGA